MKKLVLFTALCAGLLLTPPAALALRDGGSEAESSAPRTQEAPSFEDVSEGDWCYESVRYVYERGFMNGVSDSRFRPEGTVTRGMLAAILHRREGEPEAAAPSRFEDVRKGGYCENAVAWASGVGIVNGYSQTRFGPDEAVTREQMAAILYRYTTYKGYQTGELPSLDRYTDAGSVSGYAAEAMRWVVGAGVLNGTSQTTLTPKGLATRAQTAAVIARYDAGMTEAAAGGKSLEGGSGPASPDAAPAPGANPTGVPEEPKKEEPVYGPYEVVFRDYDGTVLKEETVEDGQNATPPPAPKREGCVFVGWDKSFQSVFSDLVLTAQYAQTEFPYQPPASAEKTPDQGGTSTEGKEPAGEVKEPGFGTETAEGLAWPEDGGDSPAILVGIVSGKAGEVTVPVAIRQNPGILGMTLSVLYDGSALELIGAENGAVMEGVLELTPPGRFAPQCRFLWDGLESEAEEDGEILLLRFRAEKPGTYPITVFYGEGDIVDGRLTAVDAVVRNGSVRVLGRESTE